MLRKFIALFTLVIVCWSVVSLDVAAAAVTKDTPTDAPAATTQNRSPRYPVQQASYDDADGTYTLMLLNTPAGMNSLYRTTNLQMARLSDEQIAAGDKTYLTLDGDRPVLYLTEDFRIEYQHSVTETQPDPQTGEPRTVVVRQESSFWSPFAGALAGQAIGSLLFAPRYYIPPIYHPGSMTGYGGYGDTYRQAVQRYQTKHSSLPPAVKNRQTLRTTGNIRKNAVPKTTGATKATSKVAPKTAPKASPKASKSSGSGFGTSRLKNSGTFKPLRPSGGFGSGYRMPTRSFGGGMRRR
jgi:hypothetical protein